MGIDLLQCKARLDHPFSGGALVQAGAFVCTGALVQTCADWCTSALVYTGAFVLALVQICSTKKLVQIGRCQCGDEQF